MMMSTVYTYIYVLLVVCCSFLEARDSLRTETRRRLQTGADGAAEFESDGGCSTDLSVLADGELAASFGILFAIESASTDNVGPTVASLGFHVETSLMGGSYFNYEVYALRADGYYADPERTDNILDELSYDYRGSLDGWDMVSSGEVSTQDLVVNELTSKLEGGPDYYEIPMEKFSKTSVPPNGGKRSFYLTLTATGLVSIDPSEMELNEPIALVSTESNNSPRILSGEGAINYPFPTQSYLYTTRAFKGKVLFEAQCTEIPSAVPSFAPTIVESYSPSGAPSSVPSFYPSSSPSSQPTSIPSAMPSVSPSSIPSASPTDVTKVTSGLLLTLNMPGCSEMTALEENSVAATVKHNAAADAEKNGITDLDVEIIGSAADCGRRRRLTGDGSQDAQYYRRLSTWSNAVEFSMIITGTHRPNPTSEGQPPPSADSLDLGVIAEDSINRNQEKFIRDLQNRAPIGSSLNEVESLEVEAVDLPPEGITEPFTKRPTQQLTNAPVGIETVVVAENIDNKAGYYIAAVIVFGMIIFLGSFLLFRLASRYEVRKRNMHMKNMLKERELVRDENRRRSLARWVATRRLSLGSTDVVPIHESYRSVTKTKGYYSNAYIDPSYHIDQSYRTGMTSAISDSNRSGRLDPHISRRNLSMYNTHGWNGMDEIPPRHRNSAAVSNHNREIMHNRMHSNAELVNEVSDLAVVASPDVMRAMSHRQPRRQMSLRHRQASL